MDLIQLLELTANHIRILKVYNSDELKATIASMMKTSLDKEDLDHSSREYSMENR